MTLIINANGFHKAASQSYNQRTRSGSVYLNNGSLIDYAIVATGFGADDWGERVAQMAIDAILVQFDRGNDKDVPAMLKKAIKSANHEIYWTTRKLDNVQAHISVAAVENEETLFIASVGANPVFLARGDRLTLLTMTDPTTAEIEDQDSLYVKNWRSAIGKVAEISIDHGFHIGDTMNDSEYNLAQIRGMSGLPIKEGDSILVGSQNLQSVLNTETKISQKFLDLLSLYDGKGVLDKMVPQIMTTGIEGSFSVATLQARPGTRLDYATSLRNQIIKNPVQFYNRLALAVVAVIALFAFVYLRNRPGVPDQLAQPSAVAKLSTPTPQDDGASQTEASQLETNPDDQNSAVATKEPTATNAPTNAPVPTEPSVVNIKPAIAQTDEPSDEEANASIENETKATATVEPSLTVTIEPITSTVTITVSEVATATATTAPQRAYVQPVLLNMNCAAEWQNYAQDSKIELNWRWSGRAYGNEYLEIRVGPRGGNLSSIGQVFAEPNGNFYRWFITPQGYFLDGVTKEFQWQVVHMASNGRTVLAQSGRGCFTVK